MNLVLVATVVSLMFNKEDRQAGGRWAESLGTLGGHTGRGVDSQTTRST